MVGGLNGSLDLGSGWVIRNNLSFTTGEANTLGFVPDGNPIRVSALRAEPELPSVQTRSGLTLGGSEWVRNDEH